MEGHHHMLETRSLCLSEEQTISNILKANSCGKSNFEHENSSIEVDSDVKLRQFLFYMVFPDLLYDGFLCQLPGNKGQLVAPFCLCWSCFQESQLVVFVSLHGLLSASLEASDYHVLSTHPTATHADSRMLKEILVRKGLQTKGMNWRVSS
ncbi:uncharacterized protein LOC103713090 isoform X3 [Phoenix dactylifera]|uniref:Uncharacterized protein LOC103713090 isoform X3 n=1 Tax=Phoenix dactylifera TaxID=42345 RepID=A0A8B9AMZ3_PHODC|nr:uncharacterized protein LOC103713090 isoform X3 [Phoenix dactylifera]XP_038988127.1 uncharacterized protein LOC103713090 isoform X3 [Phoenix dactylifera]